VTREADFDVDLLGSLVVNDIDAIASDLPTLRGDSRLDRRAVPGGNANVSVTGFDAHFGRAFQIETLRPFISGSGRQDRQH
jgi:hypothetical protein